MRQTLDLMGRFFKRTLALSALGLAACSSDSSTGTDILADCDLFSNKVFDGGVSRDGIPALTNPEVVNAQQADFLLPEDRVLGVVQNGVARAYPFIVMWWHEIANDTLGEQPVLVTYCPLTGSGLAFDPVVGGDLRNFGVSGLLFENNLMMFDRETESFWPQLLTSARCGPDKGTQLDVVPILETTWERWLELFPTSTVVTTNTGFSRNYGVYPYDDYDLTNNSELLFPSSPFNIERPPKEVVLSVFEGEAELAFPHLALFNRGETVAVNETIAERPIVVLWDANSFTAIAYDRRLNGDVLEFTASAAQPGLYEDLGTGSTWNQAGRAVDGPMAGMQLEALERAYNMFWFAWSIFHRFGRVVTE